MGSKRNHYGVRLERRQRRDEPGRLGEDDGMSDQTRKVAKDERKQHMNETKKGGKMMRCTHSSIHSWACGLASAGEEKAVEDVQRW